MSSPKKSEERAKDWVRSVLEEKLAHQREQTRKLLKFISSKRALTRADVENAMKVLCFNHLAYCCGVNHKCGYRDELLNAVGLTKDDYAKYKHRCENLLWTTTDIPRSKVVK